MSIGLRRELPMSSSAFGEELERCEGLACEGSTTKGGLDVLGNDAETGTVSTFVDSS